MPIHAHREHGYGVLTLNRPERAHAYDREMLDAMLAAAIELSEQPVVIVESSGARAFCGGADLDAMRGASPLDALELRSQRVFSAIARLPCVFIVAVQGAAIAGGFELALACDLRVAGPRARFSLPETKLGILPSAGGTTRLSRLLGASRAKGIILGGESLDAPAAHACGLVHRLADDAKVGAREWAAELLQRDPVALRLAKETIDADADFASLSRERTVEAILYARKRARGE